MSTRAAATRPVGAAAPARAAARWSALVLLVAACVPLPAGALGAPEVVATLRFALLGIAVPALAVLGAPWAALRIGAPRLERIAASRAAHPQPWRSYALLGIDVAVLVAWRTPTAVDAVARHPALLALAAILLVAAGLALWSELVDAPPLVARPSPVRRCVLAALAMWSVWVVAYLEAMSTTGWYPALHHAAGSSLSASADRQAAAAVLWAVSAVCFMPVVFWNLFAWLRVESRKEDPTAARLVQERLGQGPPVAPTA